MRLPPGTDVSLGRVEGDGYFVFLAAPPLTAGTHLLEPQPGSLTVLLTHDSGLAWTDKQGESLASGVLAAGGTVIMQFERLADALGAHGRLMRQVAV